MCVLTYIPIDIYHPLGNNSGTIYGFFIVLYRKYYQLIPWRSLQ